MKNGIDNFFMGKSTRREEIQQRMRNVQTNGSVIQECYDAIANRTPAEKIESAVQINNDSKYKVIRNEKSAPYVGERY